MTGFGEDVRQNENTAVTVEVRAVNNRYLKITLRCSDGCPTLEPQIESLVRRHLKRGTVQVNVRVRQVSTPDHYRVNEDVLDGYRQQLENIQRRWDCSDPIPAVALLQLPGVVDDQQPVGETNEVWSVVEPALTTALENLVAMRIEEGNAMAADLAGNLATIEQQLNEIQSRAPKVVEAYRQKLRERIEKWLNANHVETDSTDLIREVGLYAERSDISEECVRLASHIDQFRKTIDLPESSGRRLDFLTQEMFRETNTIGSKANDSDISQHVIDIKTAIERIREMVQNVE